MTMMLCKDNINEFNMVTELNHIFCLTILTMIKEKSAIDEHITEMTKDIN